MAGRVSYTGGIVRNGLVLHLDAAKRDSYPKTGTVWSDISGNGNHFSLYGTPTFNSNNGGSIQLNGTSQYCRSINTINLSSLNGFSIQIIAKTNSVAGAAVYEHGPNTNTTVGGFGFFSNSNGLITDSTTMHSFLNTNLGANGGARNISSNSQSSYFIETKTIVKNSSIGFQDYYNGQLTPYITSTWGTSTSTVGITTTFLNDYLYLGSRGGTTSFLSGNIASIIIYNRPLSASEVLQNYNALKGRYI